jgi:hypothetical protein
MAREEVRCPYCVVEDKFRLMTVVSNGRLICENCGHTVSPKDAAFKCPQMLDIRCLGPSQSSPARAAVAKARTSCKKGVQSYAKTQSSDRESRQSLVLCLQACSASFKSSSQQSEQAEREVKAQFLK